MLALYENRRLLRRWYSIITMGFALAIFLICVTSHYRTEPRRLMGAGDTVYLTQDHTNQKDLRPGSQGIITQACGGYCLVKFDHIKNPVLLPQANLSDTPTPSAPPMIPQANEAMYPDVVYPMQIAVC